MGGVKYNGGIKATSRISRTRIALIVSPIGKVEE
jgi:hypothetical protein